MNSKQCGSGVQSLALMPVCFWMVIRLSDGDVSKKKSSILSRENFAVFPTKCLYQKLEHLLSMWKLLLIQLIQEVFLQTKRQLCPYFHMKLYMIFLIV